MEYLIAFGILILIVVFCAVKYKVWDEPHAQLKQLKREIENLKNQHSVSISDLQKQHKKELNSYIQDIEILQKQHEKELNSYIQDIETLQKRHKKELNILSKKLDKRIDITVDFIKEEYADIVSLFAIKEVYELCHSEYVFLGIPYRYTNRGLQQGSTVNTLIVDRFKDAMEEQYKYKFATIVFPEITKLFDGVHLNAELFKDKTTNLFEITNALKNNEYDINQDVVKDILLLKNKLSFLGSAQSNLTAIPYMAQIMADYETYGLEHLAKELDWGYAYERKKKVKAIREIRKDARAMVEKNKDAQYQLAYLIELFPNLQDVIDCEFKQLPPIKVNEISEYDSTKDYLSKEEYNNLNVTERNQLALDRYKHSHRKTKWQIGRDYELFIGYKYTVNGYEVDYFGSYMKLEDLGRDLICKKDGKTLIVQCKYWSSSKVIHEKHITQLYGTMMSYCIENNCKKADVNGLLITNITLSDTAKKMASFLKIQFKENIAMGDYPCIKCNIGHDEFGETKIYHLPFDQKYDETKINKKGEFYATTILEAEEAGFRRAFKWFG